MRQPQEFFVVTFNTTTGAMAMEEACRSKNVPGRLIPVPRSITAGCGMCWAAPPTAKAQVEQVVIGEKLDINGFYTALI